jgi:riboflavin synthase
MFTGLVDDVGLIDRVEDSSAGRALWIRCAYTDLVVGESVAVNGVCLTVRECDSGVFSAAAVVTTRERTTIGEWSVGRRVNLERAMRLGDRLGGHLVQGHVDGVATVLFVEDAEDARLIDLEVPDIVDEVSVIHGSIAVDGVSLTVNALPAPATVQISLIPYTLAHTTLGALAEGNRVHVEGDMIGKHVRRLSEAWRSER